MEAPRHVKVAAPQSSACPRQALTRRFLILPFLLASTYAPAAADLYVPTSTAPPPIVRELRGVWVATVGNIDWPSTNALSTAQQKDELVALMDMAAELKLNTIVFQVRPACDAMYPSTFEPWSEYLTGTMGKPPEPFYDPLAFAIQEAHKRGLELHAWFNPYRARHIVAKSPVAANHISRTHPEWVRHYGKVLWLDPGEKGVQEHSLSVVMDVVRRYDIDGVHFDDYFYPYHEQDASGKDLQFPDDASWRRYGVSTHKSRDDWRRENVNSLVHRAYESIKAAKPWVKFGISPFGIWRPGNPPQVKGLDAFAIIYADSRKWLNEGWVDYLAPQLYWPIAQPETSFPVLLRWWTQQNTQGRLLCPGLKSYKVGQGWPTEELLNQIAICRHQPGVGGHMHWDMRALMRNGALDTILQRDVYTEPALVPAATWLARTPPPKPAIKTSSESRSVSANWTSVNADQLRVWILQKRLGNRWTTSILPHSERSTAFAGSPPDAIAVTSVDRFGSLSAPTVLELNHRPN